jgi:hypothetical protein
MQQRIIEIQASRADREAMSQAVFEATGDDEPFFCPARFEEGKPYLGHAHVFLTTGAVNVQVTRILVN